MIETDSSNGAHGQDATGSPANAGENSLESVHTSSLSEILSNQSISLCISTYQAGKVIIARVDDGVTNTHFRAFKKPMGVTASADRLILGTQGQIFDLRNVPSAAQKIEPEGKHTAAYMPRAVYNTGDIDIHEMAIIDDEVIFVNTRFSCLCRLNSKYSFEPIWKPDFISAYDPRDRCHLNGLAVRDHKARYVSALGTSDEPGGWRNNKTSGGVVIDILENKIIRDGLSMPHSPRWYADSLWYLESGKGDVVACNPDTGEEILRLNLPGFTRGLDFFDHYAFVGTSQVRETAVFSDLEITRNTPVRESGVWVLDIRTKTVVAFLKFTGGVREIFAVSVLPHAFPDIGSEDENLMLGTFVVPDECLANVATVDQSWKPVEKYFEAGNEHFNSGDLKTAMASYRDALAVDENYLPARYNLGLALLRDGSLAEARDTLNDVVRREAGHFEALYQLGNIAAQESQTQQCIAYFRQALKIRPQFLAAEEALNKALKYASEQPQ